MVVRKSFNRIPIGTEVYWYFSTSFAFKHSSGQWTRGSEDCVSAFTKCYHHQFCDSVPFSLWFVFVSRICILFHCLLAHRRCQNIDMNIILSVKFSGVSPNLNSKLLTSWLSCKLLNPGKIFHSNSICSPSILSKVLHSGDDLNHSKLLFPCIVWLGGSRRSYQVTIRIWKDVDFRALKIDNTFITNQRQVFPWMIFPTFCLHSRDLIMFRHLFCRYVEHLFQCEVFCIRYGVTYCSGNSFPWMLLIPLL